MLRIYENKIETNTLLLSAHTAFLGTVVAHSDAIYGNLSAPPLRRHLVGTRALDRGQAAGQVRGLGQWQMRMDS